MPEPALTVITVCLNRAGTLAAVLDSVATQRPDAVEHLLIDGGSTDGTLEIAARFGHLRVLSEPDSGLYDAMNKGVRLARGRFVCFLNSDDELAWGAIAALQPFMTGERGEFDVVCFGTDFVRETELGGNVPRQREVVETIAAPDAIALSPISATLGSPLLNAKLFRRDFLRSVGEFDLQFTLAADADLLLRAALLRPRLAVLPIVCHHYRQHADSLTINVSGANARRAAQECLAIADKALARADLPARVRFWLRAWRGGKRLAIAAIDRRAGHGPVRLLPVLAALPDVARFGGYLVQRKLRTPEQRLQASLHGW